MNIKEEAEKTLHNAEDAFHAVPEVARDVQAKAKNWQANAGRFVRENPAVALVSAFVVGFAIAKAARHV